MKRRTLLLGGLSGLGGAAALVVGWGVLPPRSRLGQADTLPIEQGTVGLNGWIAIGDDGGAILAMNRSEMGQGVHTALAMLVAEELDLPLARVRLVQAGPDRLYGNVAMFVDSLPFHPRDTEPGQQTLAVRAGEWVVSKLARELGINATGGSSSVVDAWGVLRLAAATARAQLLGAASLAWHLPVDELQVEHGVIAHLSGPRGHYGLFARAAAALPPGDVHLKPASARTLIGTSAPRIDLPGKVDGSARFGADVRLPGQCFAVVRHGPALGAGIGTVDAGETLRLAGIERIVRLGTYGGSSPAVAVVGRSYWHALRGARALQVDWQVPPAGTPSSAAIDAALQAAVGGTAGGAVGAAGAVASANVGSVAESDRGKAFYDIGDPAGVMARDRPGTRLVEQRYRAPYLAHVAMEPINCTARVAAGRVDIWVPTQVPGAARALAARVAGVAEDAVTVHLTLLGGGFGRRLEVDVVGQAVRIALETGGRPVQLTWPREEDITHDFYRPAAAALMQARLDADGLPLAWRLTSAGDAITPRWIERALPALTSPIDTPDKTTSEGLFDQPYRVPNQRVAHVATRSGVPVGYWRSVGHSYNAFFLECFVDELAGEAGRDPVAYRLALLQGAPRHAAVLRLAAEKAGWPGFGAAAPLPLPLPNGTARGVALHESFGSIVAQVVEVQLGSDGRPRVRRVVVAADIGTALNPGIVAQQIESGVVYGLSAALHGRIDIVDGVVQQTNFPNHPILTLAETPLIETHLVASNLPPGGVGEIGTPPIAPAVANALFVLTGQRVRALPLVV